MKTMCKSVMRSVLLTLILVAGSIYTGNATVLAEESYGTEITSGTCSDVYYGGSGNVVWTIYDSDGNSEADLLVFSGEGKIHTDTDNTYSSAWRKSTYRSAIETVIFEEGVQNIPEKCLYNMGSIKEVSIASSVTEIGRYAFNCAYSLESIIIPTDSKLESIGEYAFEDICISSLYLPANVKTIGDGAFHFLSPAEIILDAKNTYLMQDNQKALYDKDQTILYYASFVEGEYAIPETVTEVRGYAFAQNETLTEVSIPKSLKVLGRSAFTNCINLEKVTFADGCGIERIENSTFFKTKKLTAIDFPDTVTYIGDSSFYQSGLTSVVIPKKVTELGSEAFLSCTALQTVSFEEGCQLSYISNEIFSGCTALETVTFPEVMGTVKSNLFKNCTAIKHIYYPKGGNLGSCTNPIDATICEYEPYYNNTYQLTVTQLRSDAESVIIPANINGKRIGFCVFADDVSAVTRICEEHYLLWDILEEGHRKYCPACGYATEVEAHIDDCECEKEPVIMEKQPKGGNLYYGYETGLTLDVTAKANVYGWNLLYQWYENGVAIDGATDYTYTIPTGKDIGKYEYYCKIRIGEMEVNSDAAEVLVKSEIQLSVLNCIKVYGKDNPTFQCKLVEGTMAANHTLADLNITYSTTATKSSFTGQYEIKATAKHELYDITIQSGTMTITQANTPPTVPASRMKPAYKVKKVSQVPLPTGWTWASAHASKSLSVGKAYVATAQYTAADAACYKKVSVSVTITRQMCEKGTVLTDTASKAKYKVTKATLTNGTVTYMASTNKNATEIKIPNTITVEGITYKVTEIQAKAFAKNEKITKVTIGANVATIGANAFKSCTKLNTVIIGKSVAKIGKSAFQGCKKLKNITINTKLLTLDNIGAKAFKGTSDAAVVKVPKAKVKLYKEILVKRGLSKKATVKKK